MSRVQSFWQRKCKGTFVLHCTMFASLFGLQGLFGLHGIRVPCLGKFIRNCTQQPDVDNGLCVLDAQTWSKVAQLHTASLWKVLKIQGSPYVPSCCFAACQASYTECSFTRLIWFFGQRCREKRTQYWLLTQKIGRSLDCWIVDIENKCKCDKCVHFLVADEMTCQKADAME